MLANSANSTPTFTAPTSPLGQSLTQFASATSLPAFNLLAEPPQQQISPEPGLLNPTSQTPVPDANEATAPDTPPLNIHSQAPEGSEELRKAFEDFVGQTFFAEMIKACRSGQQPSAYFHGGRAEEIFQGQLDQVLSEELSKSSASKIADPMFELFMLKRQS